MKIGIVGLGLIGGSIFKALNRVGREFELYVVTRNDNTLRQVSPICKGASNDFLIL